MTSATTATMMKMLDTFPEALQDRALEHLREYIEDIREEMQWNESFSKSQRTHSNNRTEGEQQVRPQI
ncbi:MAG: hypothetical protein ACNY01_07370 [Desulfobacteria bacterium]